jgi:hypothetical protein
LIADSSDRKICGECLLAIVFWDSSSNHARVMDVCLLWVLWLSGNGLCDGLIPRPEESYLQLCVAVFELETSRKKGEHGPRWTVTSEDQKTLTT